MNILPMQTCSNQNIQTLSKNKVNKAQNQSIAFGANYNRYEEMKKIEKIINHSLKNSEIGKFDIDIKRNKNILDIKNLLQKKIIVKLTLKDNTVLKSEFFPTIKNQIAILKQIYLRIELLKNKISGNLDEKEIADKVKKDIDEYIYKNETITV